jgi:hypothetical protein
MEAFGHKRALEYNQAKAESDPIRAGLDKVEKKAYSSMRDVLKSKTTPKTTLTEDEISQIPFLAPCLTYKQLAHKFGLSIKAFDKLLEEDERITKLYQLGLSAVITNVSSKLIQLALDGHIEAIKFFLKTQAGWKEQQDIKITNEGEASAPPSVIVQFVGKEDLKEINPPPEEE